MALAIKSSELCICRTDNNLIVCAVENNYSFVELKDIGGIKAVLENENITKTGYVIKELIKLVAQYNISLNGVLYDTEIMNYIINPERSHKKDI